MAGTIAGALALSVRHLRPRLVLAPFFDRIAFEPGVRPITVAGQWNVYELREP